MSSHSRPPANSREGEVIGDYTLLAKIGEGGMGIVHLARHNQTGERVALKMLRPHIVGDDEARHRLAREVSSLSRITSKWVAEIVVADPWAEIPYVATRYVPGLTLHDYVPEEGPIEGRDLLWFAGCLAEGLSSVHAVGVLHRDVKPSNVLMEGRTPILIDFGLARVADDPKLTHTGWLLGTPGYLAPEILYGEVATPAADVHSWASTVVFAALGRGPFGRGPSMAVMDRVRRGEHDLAGIPDPLRGVLAASLDTDPLRRPTLPELLDWLRPQTTRPSPLLAPPPSADEVVDDFTLPLALFNAPDDAAPTLLPDAAPATRVYSEAGPTRLDHPSNATTLGPMQMSPPAHAPPVPRAEPMPQPAPPPVREPMPQAQPDWERQWDEEHGIAPARGNDEREWREPPLELAPEPMRVTSAARLRRGLLVAASALAVGSGAAVAPWVTLTLVVFAVWLLRSGSLAASAMGARRDLRGRKWFDGPQLLIHTPWHLLQSIPGTLMLVLWSAGLAIAAALVCYALVVGVEVALLVCGVAFAYSLWWGPGGSRVRSPLNHVIHPVSSKVGWWLGAMVLVVGVAAAGGVVASQQGARWTPDDQRPFPSYTP